MKRSTALFLNLTDRLDKELDKNTDLFLQERPFLRYHDKNMPDEELKEARLENEVKINVLLRKIQRR